MQSGYSKSNSYHLLAVLLLLQLSLCLSLSIYATATIVLAVWKTIFQALINLYCKTSHMLLFVYARGKRIAELINANACGCACVLIISEPENDRWGDLSRKCPLQIEQPGTSIWDCLADKGEEGALWPREATSTCSVTNLIKELSLSDPHSNPSAPPSKRQCRSLSFSDEMSSCRTSWRPLGSKVWTPVEKRRCYSGGSVQRYSNGSATMQRSSSFSLPSRSHPLASSCDHRPGCLPRRSGAGGDAWSPEGGRADMQRSLSCSHDRFSSSEPGPPSASSTPASTPQLGRRAGGLCRSRSQPCVLNDKKVGVKRRRPQDAQEPRPSLDLAKMTQVRLGAGHGLPLPVPRAVVGIRLTLRPSSRLRALYL